MWPAPETFALKERTTAWDSDGSKAVREFVEDQTPIKFLAA